MDDVETFTRLGLALAIGFLIGVERGWRERDEKEGERTAGLRTFALIGLFGGVWGLLSQEIGPAPIGLAFLAFAAAATLFRWRQTEHEGVFGMTTLMAMFVTFSLGAYAVLGTMAVAAAAAVATAGLLAAKESLHARLGGLTWPELRAALTLLAMTFVALPVLPDRGFGPYQVLNPYELWLMTIVIAGVSFTGYVATRVAGERYGPLIAGTAGGLVSSTAVTLDFARRAREAPALRRTYLSGALAASTVMFARVIVVVALFGAGLAGAVAPALAAAAAVSAAGALILNHSFAPAPATGAQESPAVKNPFEIRFVLGFAVLLAVILVLTRIAGDTLGGAGNIVLAAVAGLADVDAITLSMTRLAGGPDATVAAIAIIVAVASNSVSKSVLAMTVGGVRFGLGYAAVTALSLAAGTVAALAWSGL
ncbi:MAG: DUF4010 domain-containing protein [Bauldia sp.]|nr:DUF4010 domain-containing protein [Bauldia sp.]